MAQLGNTNGFKRGFDANRYTAPNMGLAVHKNKIGDMVRQRVPPQLIVNYLSDLMTSEDTSPALGFQVAKYILDRALGVPLPVDKQHELNKRIEADKSLSHYSNEEIREQITTLEEELFSRDRIEIILNEYRDQVE